jgi:hypothetical protein
LSNLGSRRRGARLLNFLGRFFDGDDASMAIALGFVRMVRRVFSIADGFESKVDSQLIGYVLIDGAGVRHFFRHSHVR